MHRLTLVPVTLALLFVLALAWGASAQDGPLVPPDDPTPAAPMTSPGTTTPTPHPNPPVAEPVNDRDEPATPSAPPATPTPTAPAPPATPGTPQDEPDDAPVVPIRTPDGAWIGVVTSQTLNIRHAPSLATPIIGTTWAGHLVTVVDEVSGDAVDGTTRWFRIGPQQYVSAALVEVFVPPAPLATHPGHWVDVNLSAFYAVAYDGITPVYAAIIRSGKPGYETPTGEFSIVHRVASETMDAGTLGVDPGDPEYYVIPDVPATQYFAEGGYAMHGNTWTDPSAFGHPGSHGCVNLLPDDATFFWDFLTWGSAVSIHD